MVKKATKDKVKRVLKSKLFRVLAVLIGIVAVIVAGFGIAYAVKKKNILLVKTTSELKEHPTPDGGVICGPDSVFTVVEVKMKRDKDESKMFTGSDSGVNYKIELGSDSDQGEARWLLTENTVLKATHEPLDSAFIPTSFLEYDPPVTDSNGNGSGWKNKTKDDTTVYKHSWY